MLVQIYSYHSSNLFPCLAHVILVTDKLKYKMCSSQDETRNIIALTSAHEDKPFDIIRVLFGEYGSI